MLQGVTAGTFLLADDKGQNGGSPAGAGRTREAGGAPEGADTRSSNRIRLPLSEGGGHHPSPRAARGTRRPAAVRCPGQGEQGTAGPAGEGARPGGSEGRCPRRRPGAGPAHKWRSPPAIRAYKHVLFTSKVNQQWRSSCKPCGLRKHNGAESTLGTPGPRWAARGRGAPGKPGSRTRLTSCPSREASTQGNT